MYRTHLCNEINSKLENQTTTIAGWVRVKRNHGTILFIDLYDSTCSVQCICEKNSPYYEILSKIGLESVISIQGVIKKRSNETINPKIASGEVELEIININILNEAEELPFSLFQKDLSQELQLKYRFLYLRTKSMQQMLKLRTDIIDFLRTKMKTLGFQEIQTPLLSSSSPEGARDYLVPSRLNPGKFFALPQAPQQFKQLLMASGIAKYFQIAPCFRDEDSRADRLLGEFYQLDFEVAFATQENILSLLEDIISSLFINFGHEIENHFPRISYKIALETYGSDKPDLRNPLKLIDITDIEIPSIFENLVKNKGKLITLACTTSMNRKFFEEIANKMQKQGAKGLAYCCYKENQWSGPLSKMLNIETIKKITKKDENTIFLIADEEEQVYKLGGILRNELGKMLNLINEDEFKFCFITDFPMFEKKDDKWVFMHNPFSMPHDLDLPIGEINSQQYDVVCNGYEITSGAVRNHCLENIKKTFALIGENYDLEHRFPIFKAFKYGIPPHAGAAPGIDRLIMLLSGKKNVRDIVAFPLDQKGESSLMDAPSIIDEKTLSELGIKLIKKTEYNK